jgi:hypothetical protein
VFTNHKTFAHRARCAAAILFRAASAARSSPSSRDLRYLRPKPKLDRAKLPMVCAWCAVGTSKLYLSLPDGRRQREGRGSFRSLSSSLRMVVTSFPSYNASSISSVNPDASSRSAITCLQVAARDLPRKGCRVRENGIVWKPSRDRFGRFLKSQATKTQLSRRRGKGVWVHTETIRAT